MLYYERKFKKKGCDFVIGVDEVGRGSLAGPVVAAAVSLKTGLFQNRIDDSKKLSALQREKAFPEIVSKSVFGIGIINERIVDRLNIGVATRLAMEEAIAELIDKLRHCRKSKIHILVDGIVRINTDYPFSLIIKGDSRSKSIACASILAKVIRDRMMSVYHKVYPQYGFLKHKGYGTKMHRRALEEFGPCRIHRASFCSA
ncbi:MAG: ribonuclease HII [Candidatus Omnitrophica bacterium]|nr:ribonuclease HII [Candidatus Omnitrophota bacterium]